MHASAYLFSPTSPNGRPELGVGLQGLPVRVPQPGCSGSEAPGRLASGKAPAVVLRLHSRQRSARTNLRSAFSDVESSTAGQVPVGADPHAAPQALDAFELLRSASPVLQGAPIPFPDATGPPGGCARASRASRQVACCRRVAYWGGGGAPVVGGGGPARSSPQATTRDCRVPDARHGAFRLRASRRGGSGGTRTKAGA